MTDIAEIPAAVHTDGAEAPSPESPVSSDPSKALKQAWGAFRQGRIQESHRICRLHLFALQGQAAAGFWALDGLIQRQQRYHEAAVRSLRAALLLGPDEHWIRYTIGMSFIDMRNAKPAIAHLRKAVEMQPRTAEYLLRLGFALQIDGRHEDAEPFLQRALETERNRPELHFRLGITAQRLGETEKALSCYAEALRLSPHYQEVWHQRGALRCEMGLFDPGLADFQRAIDLDPQNPDLWLRRASALFAKGLLDEAVRHVQRALRMSPGLVEAHVLMGKLATSRGDMDLAEQCFTNALKLQPDDPYILSAKAAMLERQGEDAAARELIAPTLDSLSDHQQLLLLQTRLAKDDEERKMLIQRIEKRLENSSVLPADARAQLHFSTAYLYDRIKSSDNAFQHLEAGNTLRKSARPFSRSRVEREFRDIREVFTRDFLDHAPRSHLNSEKMIFIVGMPRSGTSLTEQILASHSQVYGAGELMLVGRLVRHWPDDAEGRAPVPYPQYLRDIDADVLTELAYRYLNRLPKDAAGHLRATDKMPYNYLHLGMISLLFPRARIVHCRRNPVDTAFSCYFQDFVEGNAFSYDTADCGWYYRQYHEHMNHWQNVIDHPVLDLHYEELVSDPEPSVRRLLDFCGLDWDESCLRFHENQRLVNTASYRQVKQPFYTRSVGRWKAYEPHLVPLLGELGELVEQYPY